MKAFDFIQAVSELGISNNVYAPFSKTGRVTAATFGGSLLFGAIPDGYDLVAVWSDSEDGKYLIAKLKATPDACIINDNQYIFIYEME